MKNKIAKKLITDLLDKKHGVPLPFGHYFDGSVLMVCFVNGWGPDNYHEDSEVVECGTVSIKGKV